MNTSRIHIGPAMDGFCGNDAFLRRSLARAADAVLIPAVDGKSYGSPMTGEEFEALHAFVTELAPLFRAAGVLRIDRGQPDNIEAASQGHVLTLTGEAA